MIANSRLPIVYSERYNITFFGLEKRHPFDSTKYRKIHRHLVDKVGLKPEAFHTPPIASNDDLLRVHTPEYLDSLSRSRTLAAVAEMPILNAVPNALLQRRLLDPVRYGTGGTVLACELALSHGWAINLGGGYHHAKREQGGGFCFFADIPLAIHKLWDRRPDLRVLVVDLDAHQGNGVASVLRDDPRVKILDVYGEHSYPQDFEARRHISFGYPLQPGTLDQEYLPIVQKGLAEGLAQFTPDLIVYNAGTDVLEGDVIGGLSVSPDGVVKRDEEVFGQALTANVPAAMVLSGGYTRASAAVVGRSIENLLRNVLPVKNPL